MRVFGSAEKALQARSFPASLASLQAENAGLQDALLVAQQHNAEAIAQTSGGADWSRLGGMCTFSTLSC